MAVVTRQELEDAQRDVEDLGKIVNGAADLVNPGKAVGTVTTREGETVRTLAKLVADGADVVAGLLTPLVYETDAAMQAIVNTQSGGEYVVKAGQTCYNKETTQIYIMTSEDDGEGGTVRTWYQVSDLSQAASASFDELLLRATPVGRMSVDDYEFMREYDKFFDKWALQEKFIKWPGIDTTGNGLAKFFDAAATAWPTGPYGQNGVDFGLKTEFDGNLGDATADPRWDSIVGRIAVKTDSASKVVEELQVNGLISIDVAVTDSVYIRNCVVDTNYLSLTAVAQSNIAPVHIDFCHLKKFTAQGIILYRGSISNCYVEQSKADGLKGDFIYGGVIYNNLVRLLGQIDVSAHGDCLQCQNSKDLRIIGNTFYMPGTGTTYDEATYGSTQTIRLVTENNTSSHLRSVILGNLCIGGGYSLAVRSRFSNGETSKVENVIMAHNVVGGPNYHVYGDITNEHGTDVSVGVIRNLLFHNNMRPDGTPISYGGVNQNGIWHYDKEKATPLFIECGKRWGYLDWNGDIRSGINNRDIATNAPGSIPTYS